MLGLSPVRSSVFVMVCFCIELGLGTLFRITVDE